MQPLPPSLENSKAMSYTLHKALLVSMMGACLCGCYDDISWDELCMPSFSACDYDGDGIDNEDDAFPADPACQSLDDGCVCVQSDPYCDLDGDGELNGYPDDEGTESSSSSTGGSYSDGGGCVMSTYPSGSHGRTVGARIANLGFLTEASEDFFFQDLRDEDPEKKLLLLATAAGWCTACFEHQSDLEEIKMSYQNLGLTVMVALFQDDLYMAATGSHASLWKDYFDLTFRVVADPYNQLTSYYDYSQAPMYVLVDLCTMEIVELQVGIEPWTLVYAIQEQLW
jgi:hypothetical protein